MYDDYNYFNDIDQSGHLVFPIKNVEADLAIDPNLDKKKLLAEIGIHPLSEFIPQKNENKSETRKKLIQQLRIGISENLSNKKTKQTIDAIFKFVPIKTEREQGIRVVCIVDAEIVGTFSCNFNESNLHVYHTEKAVKKFEGFGISSRMFQYATEVLQSIGINNIEGEIKIDNQKSLNSRRWKSGILGDDPYKTELKIKYPQDLKSADTYIVTTKLDEFITPEQARIEQALQKNFLTRFSFPSNTSIAEKAESINTCVQLASKQEKKVFEVEKTEKILQRIQKIIDRAKIVLTQMGLHDAAERVPIPEQILIKQPPKGKKYQADSNEISGSAGSLYISINAGSNIDFEKEEDLDKFDHTLAHEIAHFSADFKVKHDTKSPSKIEEIGLGYEELVIEDDQPYLSGTWEETTADIFALLVKDDETQIISTPYVEHIAFMICFTLAFSDKLGLSPLSGFNQLFNGKTTISEDLKNQIYGQFRSTPGEKVTSRSLFRLLTIPEYGRKPVGNLDAFAELAEAAGFGQDFLNILNEMSHGELEIAKYIPGIKGKITKRNESDQTKTCAMA